MGAPVWTDEEDRILTKGRSVGMKFHEIGKRIGRTKKACMARYNVLTRDPGLYVANAANDEIRRASAKLRDAILSYFYRVMNESGDDMNEVIHKILGKEPERNSVVSRHIHKTASMERHVNTVQALGMAA